MLLLGLLDAFENAFEKLHLRGWGFAWLSALHDVSIWAERGLSSRLDVSDGRRWRSNLGEFCALEPEVPPVDDL